MNLYLVEHVGASGWDIYLAIVVAAFSEKQAAETPPNDWGDDKWDYEEGKWYSPTSSYSSLNSDWAPVPDLRVTCIGEAKEGTEAGLILASYRAG